MTQAHRRPPVVAALTALALDWPASTVPVTDIERPWKRDRRTGPMAIGAGGAWAGVMLSFGWVLFSFCGGFSSGEGDGLVEFAGVTILTTGAAAAVGAVFGSALPHWRLIHPRPPDAGKGSLSAGAAVTW